MAETPSTLCTRVFGKRVRGAVREYWINDGLYGSMNCKLYDHAVLSARPLLLRPAKPLQHGDAATPCALEDTTSAADVSQAAATFSSTVFGPTCDGLDVVLQSVPLPELEMGDWLVFPSMGAYTAAAGSSFNGFSTSELSTHLVFSSSAPSLEGEPTLAASIHCLSEEPPLGTSLADWKSVAANRDYALAQLNH